jgi:hypothetical protein
MARANATSASSKKGTIDVKITNAERNMTLDN